jgi:hypothetical protein
LGIKGQQLSRDIVAAQSPRREQCHEGAQRADNGPQNARLAAARLGAVDLIGTLEQATEAGAATGDDGQHLAAQTHRASVDQRDTLPKRDVVQPELLREAVSSIEPDGPALEQRLVSLLEARLLGDDLATRRQLAKPFRGHCAFGSADVRLPEQDLPRQVAGLDEIGIEEADTHDTQAGERQCGWASKPPHADDGDAAAHANCAARLK